MGIYSHVHRNILLPLWDRYQGQNYHRYIGQVAQFCKLSNENMKERQLEDIRKVLDNASRNVPFYRKSFEAKSIDPLLIKSFRDFEKIPILSKTDLRNNPESFLNVLFKRDTLIKSGTGGTTDSPIPIYYDQIRSDIKMAEMVYFRKWFGWLPESKVVYLWGAPLDIPSINSWKYKIKNKLFLRTLYLFANIINDEVMYEYVKKLNEFKPDIIQAYSNPAYLVASYINKNNCKVYTPKSVVVTAEPCYPSQRDVIEKAFGCKVYSFYGARESGYIAVECSHHKNYHINSHGLYLEILKNGHPAAPGEIGDVVITDLINLAMPLIRYKIGDMAAISTKNCGCGCELPLLEFIAGRETDVFVMPDGDLIPGVSLCDRVVEDCAGFSQMQFVQECPSSLIVKIVKGKQYKEEDLVRLDQILIEYFKNKLVIEKIFVDDIPKEKSGKTRFCISKVPLSVIREIKPVN